MERSQMNSNQYIKCQLHKEDLTQVCLNKKCSSYFQANCSECAYYDHKGDNAFQMINIKSILAKAQNLLNDQQNNKNSQYFQRMLDFHDLVNQQMKEWKEVGEQLKNFGEAVSIRIYENFCGVLQAIFEQQEAIEQNIEIAQQATYSKQIDQAFSVLKNFIDYEPMNRQLKINHIFDKAKQKEFEVYCKTLQQQKKKLMTLCEQIEETAQKQFSSFTDNNDKNFFFFQNGQGQSSHNNNQNETMFKQMEKLKKNQQFRNFLQDSSQQSQQRGSFQSNIKFQNVLGGLNNTVQSSQQFNLLQQLMTPAPSSINAYYKSNNKSNNKSKSVNSTPIRIKQAISGTITLSSLSKYQLKQQSDDKINEKDDNLLKQQVAESLQGNQQLQQQILNKNAFKVDDGRQVRKQITSKDLFREDDEKYITYKTTKEFVDKHYKPEKPNNGPSVQNQFQCKLKDNGNDHFLRFFYNQNNQTPIENKQLKKNLGVADTRVQNHQPNQELKQRMIAPNYNQQQQQIKEQPNKMNQNIFSIIDEGQYSEGLTIGYQTPPNIKSKNLVRQNAQKHLLFDNDIQEGSQLYKQQIKQNTPNNIFNSEDNEDSQDPWGVNEIDQRAARENELLNEKKMTNQDIFIDNQEYLQKQNDNNFNQLTGMQKNNKVIFQNDNNNNQIQRNQMNLTGQLKIDFNNNAVTQQKEIFQDIFPLQKKNLKNNNTFIEQKEEFKQEMLPFQKANLINPLMQQKQEVILERHEQQNSGRISFLCNNNLNNGLAQQKEQFIGQHNNNVFGCLIMNKNPNTFFQQNKQQGTNGNQALRIEDDSIENKNLQTIERHFEQLAAQDTLQTYAVNFEKKQNNFMNKPQQNVFQISKQDVESFKITNNMFGPPKIFNQTMNCQNKIDFNTNNNSNNQFNNNNQFINNNNQFSQRQFLGGNNNNFQIANNENTTPKNYDDEMKEMLKIIQEKSSINKSLNEKNPTVGIFSNFQNQNKEFMSKNDIFVEQQSKNSDQNIELDSDKNIELGSDKKIELNSDKKIELNFDKEIIEINKLHNKFIEKERSLEEIKVQYQDQEEQYKDKENFVENQLNQTNMIYKEKKSQMPIESELFSQSNENNNNASMKLEEQQPLKTISPQHTNSQNISPLQNSMQQDILQQNAPEQTYSRLISLQNNTSFQNSSKQNASQKNSSEFNTSQQNKKFDSALKYDITNKINTYNQIQMNKLNKQRVSQDLSQLNFDESQKENLSQLISDNRTDQNENDKSRCSTSFQEFYQQIKQPSNKNKKISPQQTNVFQVKQTVVEKQVTVKEKKAKKTQQQQPQQTAQSNQTKIKLRK